MKYVINKEKLESAMFDNGMTHKLLADEAKLSRITVHNVINGKHSPTAKTALAISNVLGYKPSELFEKVED